MNTRTNLVDWLNQPSRYPLARVLPQLEKQYPETRAMLVRAIYWTQAERLQEMRDLMTMKQRTLQVLERIDDIMGDVVEGGRSLTYAQLCDVLMSDVRRKDVQREVTLLFNDIQAEKQLLAQAAQAVEAFCLRGVS